MLQAWLDFHRQTLLTKCAGLTAEQLRPAAVPPSGLTLLGLVRHMTEVERCWFRAGRGRGHRLPLLTPATPTATSTTSPAPTPTADFAAFVAECAAADAAVADWRWTRRSDHGGGKDLSLRWVYLHMIEEYARHNGHADLLRERIDGVTGWREGETGESLIG